MSDLALTFDLLLQFRLHFSRKGFVCTFHAGGHSISLGLCPTKLPVKWDIQLGQLDVPALVSNFVNGDRLSQVPACRIFHLRILYCTVVAIWSYLGYLGIYTWFSCIRTFLRARTLKILLTDDHALSTNFLVRFTGLFLHVRCIPQQKFAMMFLSKCVKASVGKSVCV